MYAKVYLISNFLTSLAKEVILSTSLTGMMVKWNRLHCSKIDRGSGDYLALYFVPMCWKPVKMKQNIGI